MAVNKLSSSIGYVHDLLLSLQQNARDLPAETSTAVANLVEICRKANVAVDLASVLRDAIPHARLESAFHLLGLGEAATSPRSGDVPDVVKVVTPAGDIAFCFPNTESSRWIRLGGRIETRLVDELLRAEGFPVFGRDLEAFRGCVRPWTKVVWRVNDVAPGGAGVGFIEVCGRAARVRGQKRKADPEDERADDRLFLIRRHRWRLVEPLMLDALVDIEDAVLERFGKPTPLGNCT